ncbi:MAG: helix-turn-helix transcriptional regulator [Bacteroidales bacterium]|jgi:DNA-binding HxlR family transcriptional regulator|nr:helix-turn-helix transcriptional regulator [Bacteroidales bacterium]
MDKKEIHSATVPDCPIRNVISHITDKWSLLVLYTLEQKEVLRFKDLWREIPDISQKMLTSTLRKLADDGIVSREVFTEVPPRVEYRLSERGQSLMPHLDALISWGLEHQNSILKDRTKHSKSNN